MLHRRGRALGAGLPVPGGCLELGLQASFVWLVLILRIAEASDAGAALKAGDAAFAKGEFTAAVGLYTRAVQADSKGLLPLTKRAAAHGKLGEHRSALRDLDQALHLDSSSVQALLYRARLHKSLCSFSAAEADLKTLQGLRPTHKGAAKELSEVSKGQQQLQKATTASASSGAAAARKALAAVFEVAPSCLPAKLLEARLMLQEQDHGGVVALTGQLLKGQPGNVEALLMRGQAYTQLGDLDMAKRHYGEALRHEPDHAAGKAAFSAAKKLASLKSKAEAAQEQGKWREADPLLTEALAIDPTARLINTALWLGLCKARINLRKGDRDTLEACQQAVDHNAEDPEPLVLRVRGLLLNGDHDAASRAATDARSKFLNSRQVLQVAQEAEKARRMAERKDYYAILGVAQQAEARDIKQAYRRRAQLYHPDKAAAAGIAKEEAERQFHDLAEAYEVLSDEEKRAAYDRGDDVELGPGQAGGGGSGFPGGFPGGFGGGGQQFHFRFG